MKREVIIIQFSIILGFFAIWQISANAKIIPSYLTGTPLGALNALNNYIYSSSFYKDIKATILEFVIGLFFGIIFGLFLGIIIGSSDKLTAIFAPFFSSLMGIPKVVLAPFIILAFGGISQTSKIFLAAYGSFLIIFHTVHSGMRVVDKKYLMFFEVYRASKFKILTKLYLPYSMIWLTSSLRLAIPIAFAGAIVGEFLAGVNGLGVRLVYYESLFYPDGILAITFLIVLIILAFLFSIEIIERRVLKWR